MYLHDSHTKCTIMPVCELSHVYINNLKYCNYQFIKFNLNFTGHKAFTTPFVYNQQALSIHIILCLRFILYAV